MKEEIELLKRVSTFSMLPDELLFKLAGELEEKMYAEGELLFHLGDPGDSLYIIDRGRVRVYLDISGKPLTLQEFGPGNAIGEMALIDGNPRSANVVALEETCIWRLDRKTYMDALQEQPEIALALLHELSNNLRFANAFIEKAAEWSRSVADAQYDDAIEGLEQVHTEEAERIEGFMRAFSSMVTEVQAREEAYRREVQELRIIIDESKRDKQLKAIETSISFQEIAEQGRRLREERKKRQDRSGLKRQ
jgi:CRP-like cAMP-binding protein